MKGLSFEVGLELPPDVPSLARAVVFEHGSRVAHTSIALTRTTRVVSIYLVGDITDEQRQAIEADLLRVFDLHHEMPWLDTQGLVVLGRARRDAGPSGPLASLASIPPAGWGRFLKDTANQVWLAGLDSAGAHAVELLIRFAGGQ
jgi:hypothetical protein